VCLATAGCGGSGAESGGTCRATIGANRLPISASSQVVEFLPDGQARAVANVVLKALPVSAMAGIPPRPSITVQADVARLQGALEAEVARTPASAIAEVWRSDGRAVIARLISGAYLVTFQGRSVRKAQLVGTGCWNFADPQFDDRGRAVARAVLAPAD
jgi:hypothetical protein